MRFPKPRFIRKGSCRIQFGKILEGEESQAAMGATSSSSAEADRLLRGLSPKEIAEAEKGFEDLRGPDGVITPATYTARLPGPCRPLPQALGERLFRVVYEVPEGESTVDWVQFLRTLLRVKGNGSTRHARDAFKSHDDILACTRR